MHSPSPKTTIFVFIVFALLFSLKVSGNDVWKREPQNQSPQPTSSPAPVTTSPSSPNSPSGGSSGTSPPSSAASGSASASNTQKGSASHTSGTSAPTPPSPDTPAILVQMTNPAITEKNILYKIGSNITFQWGYTGNFSAGYAPEKINVFAQSSLDLTNYYTIAANASGNTTKVIWITATESSLPMATYRLFICDQRGLNGTPMPGALSVFSGLQFGMYTPQGRTDLPEFSCATCGAVGLDIPYIPLLATFGISLITLIYFSFGLS